MRKTDFDSPRWYFVQVPADVVSGFRRWNVIMIAILAFLILGLLVIAIVPHPVNTTATNTAQFKNHKQHTP
ncbi:MAG: hypothetical protein WBW90_03320 [Candidatus Acidiferrum sp.]